jgi:hypothetical protein
MKGHEVAGKTGEQSVSCSETYQLPVNTNLSEESVEVYVKNQLHAPAIEPDFCPGSIPTVPPDISSFLERPSKLSHNNAETIDLSKQLNLLNGDCQELMALVPDNSVGFICCDLPYGVSQNKWDSISFSLGTKRVPVGSLHRSAGDWTAFHAGYIL